MWKTFHEKNTQYDLQSNTLVMLPQTTIIRYGNDSLIASYEITFHMILKGKPQSALLRKLGVETTATAKFINIEDVIAIALSSLFLFLLLKLFLFFSF